MENQNLKNAIISAAKEDFTGFKKEIEKEMEPRLKNAIKDEVTKARQMNIVDLANFRG